MKQMIEINYHLMGDVFYMLSQAKHVDDAKKALRIIFGDYKNRQYLLQNSQILFKCLNRFGSPALLADFLMHFNDVPWFAEGLQCFARLAEKNKETNALNKALIKISQQACEKTLDEEAIDNMLAALIGSEETARIVLHDFLKDNLNTPIAKACSDFIQTLTSFFVKSQVVCALKVLNQQRDWRNSYLYRLILMVFHLQHKAIFQAKEYRFSRRQAWQADEIKEVVLFARRYANTGNQHDPKQTILKNLLTELAFRAANFGQIGIFYLNSDRFDRHMAYFTLEKLTLSLGENFFLWTENVKRSLSKKSPTQLELEKNLAENKAVIDWQKLAQDTFHLNQHNQMPLYKAYLYHYTGRRIKAEKLLHDLLSEKDENKLQGILYHLSDVAFKTPNRDMSRVIFRALENSLKLRPNLIDSLILFNMSQCHQRLHLRNQKVIPIQDAMLSLVKHFGKQRHYKLVQACCKFMLSSYITDKNTRTLRLKQTLEKIKREAKVEQGLSAISNRWYFPIAKFFRRLRYYGLSHRPSSYVKYCDDDKKYIYFDSLPDNITTNMMSGQEVYNQLRLYDNIPRLKDMKKRLNNMVLSEKSPPKNEKPCRIYFFQDDSVVDRQEQMALSCDI